MQVKYWKSVGNGWIAIARRAFYSLKTHFLAVSGKDAHLLPHLTRAKFDSPLKKSDRQPWQRHELLF